MSAPTVEPPVQPAGEQHYSDLVQILAGAAIIATNFWDREDFDIYECVKRSWSVRGRAVAFATVVRATRKVLPGGDLYAYNDAPGRTAKEISAVFARATARELGESQQLPRAMSASFTGGGDR
ncbi:MULTISPECIES: DUF6197 family protein [Mycolicibacter]|uniref:Uncharacterized protein n=1 Tax=Mycolicibacter longobardus TaxID=1108812 RepID=A0A1X1YA76_9MYCO|nr:MULTISPECIES: hypothetical protein [Mycolicibacter]ORW08022.1 hypothetical protein AWC16_19995 [Mycolicibacter longobardus]RAV04327.1 hypothetical protein DQP56_00470 [Mycolicibacter senuensis]